MPDAILPEFLKHCAVDGLTRLGRNHDGGYLVFEGDVDATSILISLGINDDWSFEESFLLLNPVPLFAYDGSIRVKFIRRKFIKAQLNIFNPIMAWRRRKFYKSLARFFTDDRILIEKFVGPSAAFNQVSLDTVLSPHEGDGVFLKIDIEGGEYRILDDILRHQGSLVGLVIEFHDCDLHLARMERFVEKLRLRLVHVHANNHAPISKAGLPLVLELTFSRTAKQYAKASKLPHKLDMPNNPDAEEIYLTG